MSTTTNARSQARYLELVRRFPLRPIAGEKELGRAIEVVDSLLDRPKLSRDEQDYLEVLSDLIEKYEDRHYQFKPVPDAEMLTFLIESKRVSQSQVAKQTGIPDSVLSNVRHGKRTLNRGQIAKLSQYFGVEPTVFEFNPNSSDA